MSGPVLPDHGIDGLVRHLRDLERRIATLERSRGRLTAATAREGTITILDAAGTRRAVFGRQDDGKYGLRVWTSAGVLSVDDTTS